MFAPKLRRLLVSAAACAALAAGPLSGAPAAPAGDLPLPPGARQDPFRPDPRPDPRPVPRVRPHPDPAAERIAFALVSRSPREPRLEGTVRITAVVRNRGAGAYHSRPGQQEALLYEDGRIVARRAFVHLAPGAELTLAYTRAWRVADEFPPVYRLVISYDPDIRADGNPDNDDANTRNNQLTRPGIQISQLF